MSAAALSNPWKRREHLTAHDTYYEYERRVGHDVLVPLLDRQLGLDGLSVADFGCHQGGVLAALRDDGRIARGVGYELKQSVLDASPFEPDSRFHLERCDLLAIERIADPVDLVLMLEVLEHVAEPERLLTVAHDSLRSGGRAFVTFPPYWSPFGGHQHYASTWLRRAPYAHYLPESVVVRLARVRDLPYMSSADAVDDMRSVRRARLSLKRAEHAFARTGFEIESRELYLLRPEFLVREGIRPRRLRGIESIPVLREVLTMGAHYLLRAT